MNGPEHYRQAENFAAQAHTVDPEFAAYLVAKAQVHATLALAAAAAGHRTTWANPDDNYSATYVEGDWAEVLS